MQFLPPAYEGREVDMKWYSLSQSERDSYASSCHSRGLLAPWEFSSDPEEMECRLEEIVAFPRQTAATHQAHITRFSPLKGRVPTKQKTRGITGKSAFF